MYYDYRIVDILFSTKFSCDDDNYWKTEDKDEDKTFETTCAFVEIQCPYYFNGAAGCVINLVNRVADY